MYALVQAVLHSDEKTDLRQLIHELKSTEKCYFLRTEILKAFEDYCHTFKKPAYFYRSSLLGELIHYTHELLLEDNSVWFILRPRIASQDIFRLSADLSSAEAMTPQSLLDLRDRLVHRPQFDILEIDMGPFYNPDLLVQDPRSVGQGLQFLSRYLSQSVFTDAKRWIEVLFDVMQRQHYNGVRLLINDRIHTAEQLPQQVRAALDFLAQQAPHEPYANLHWELQSLGLEPGWGNTTSRARETLELLERLIHNPESVGLDAFVARLPGMFRVVLVSVHGWVGQEGVLGRSETAGQVAYVLDQARHLDHKLHEDLKLAGLDQLGIHPQVVILTRLIPNCEGTQCNLRLEKVQGTENTWILRVPFSHGNPNVIQNWISKFEIWPYLEAFAINAERDLLAHLGGRPDLIIGNYTDGNLVAFLLARRWQVTHCHIAHSLEKPKYLFSDLYWQDLEDQYHFSLQFTADLIGMNAANFVVASSHQEIMGTPETTGQYESYKCFTMPQLYHVLNGVELCSPKFNVVPPGINEHLFFPYTQTKDRVPAYRDRVYDLLFVRQSSNILGELHDLSKRPLFSLSPLRAVKNLTGLVECFGASSELRQRCNLVLMTGKLHPDEAATLEERREIEQLLELVQHYELYGHIRWVGMPLSGLDLSESYRVIADHQGIFVLSARFEAFGLTLLEAMISGLPTFATEFGGPAEIIEHGKSGMLMNPNNLEEMEQRLLDFLAQCDADPEYWQQMSEQAIQRVQTLYTWQRHTEKLLLLAKTYHFWNYFPQGNQEALLRYLEVLFYFIYRPRAEQMLADHMQR